MDIRVSRGSRKDLVGEGAVNYTHVRQRPGPLVNRGVTICESKGSAPVMISRGEIDPGCLIRTKEGRIIDAVWVFIQKNVRFTRGWIQEIREFFYVLVDGSQRPKFSIAFADANV